MCLLNKNGLMVSFINVREYGQYTIQECSLTNIYTIWDKEERSHITKNDSMEAYLKNFEGAYSYNEEKTLIFSKKEDAESFASYLSQIKEAQFIQTHPELFEDWDKAEI